MRVGFKNSRSSAVAAATLRFPVLKEGFAVLKVHQFQVRIGIAAAKAVERELIGKSGKNDVKHPHVS